MANPKSEDLTLVIGGRQLSGWLETRVTRGIERCPADFEISMTELFPGQARSLVVQPGDACQVLLGQDKVITGYVDRFIPSIEPDAHRIMVSGRSKSQDLVDCCAEWPGGQIAGSSALEIAKKLAQPYGITITAEVDTGAPIPQFNLTLGESAYAIIERICRYRGLLIYDLPDGTVTLAQAGNGKMASGIVQKKNVLRATFTNTADQRFSVYESFLQSMDVLGDLGEGGNLLSKVEDPGVKRHRQRDIISEGSGQGNDVARQRALWEAARRAGRSYQLSASVDAWRDDAGTLWTPNNSIPVELPILKVPTPQDLGSAWLIGEVSFIKDAQGTRADMIIMPRQAFLPEPILLQPYPADVAPQR